MQQYLDLLEHVLKHGNKREDRTGTGTISMFGTQTRYNLQDGFPLVTTKKCFLKGVIAELLWFLEGSTNERRLAEIQYGKPASELIGKKTIWTANADTQGKALGYENTDLVEELGPVYGEQWIRTSAYYIDEHSPEKFTYNNHDIDQIANVIESIKTNPDSRRHIVSAWNVAKIDEMALPPCHTMFQFYVNNGKLDCQLYQRSADLFLGVPFNIASYALLTMMIAQVCKLEPGEFIHTIGDAHIYSNHIEAVKLQISRKPYKKPLMFLDSTIKDIDDFTMDSFVLKHYEHHEAIKAPMAV